MNRHESDWTMKYFPERFRRRHNSAYRLATQLLLGQQHLMPTQEMLDRMIRQQTEEYNALIAKMPADQRPKRPTPVISNVMAPAFHLAKFHVCGRQIYDVSPRMLKVLASANYEEVPANMLVLPFPSVYLHFGPQEFTIKGAPFEGALISIEQGIVEIIFVTTPTKGWQDGTMISHPTQYLYLSLDWNTASADTDLGVLVQESIAKERQTLGEQAQRPESVTSVDGAVLVDRRGAGSQEDLENFEVGIQSLDDAMNLVINTIIYITSYREHVNTRWSDDTPEDLARAADGSGRPKQVIQAKARVIEGGYYKTNFVGEACEHGEDGAGGPPGGGTVAPHWRRAHWRIQVCGVGRQDRKLILVPRVLVNAGRLSKGREVPGRVSRI